MPKSLTKVQKHIAKKKGANAALHENSRDSRRLQRASARDDKLLRLASVREKGNKPYLERMLYIRSKLQEDPAHKTFTTAEAQAIILSFLHRFDEELSTLKSQRRPGRPSSTREDLLKQRQAAEEKEYMSGFWMPDFADEANIDMLREWNGEWVALGRIKFVRIAKNGARHDSSFPPKGMS